MGIMTAHACLPRISRTPRSGRRERRARVTVLEEGGHIAEIFDKRSGVNPLWTPPVGVDRAVHLLACAAP